jgi:hypothetical protein
MKKIIFAITTVLALSFSALAEEGHTVTTVTGSHSIDLKEYDHSVAGSVKDFVIFGNVFESENKSELLIKKDGQLIKSVFEQKDKTIKGQIEHTVGAQTFKTEIEFKGLKKDTNEFFYDVNGQSVVVRVKFDRFENNHYFNPEYTFTFKNETYTYKINDGQACYRYTALLSFIMIGALVH